MVLVKATEHSEAGIMPSTEFLGAMGRHNEELVDAGILLAGEGLKPSSQGKRVAFDGPRRQVMDSPFSATNALVAGFRLWANRTWMKTAIAALLILAAPLLLACGDDDDADHDRLSRTDVEQIVQAAIADIPAPAAPAPAPRKSDPEAYTRFVVDSAISMYESEGLDATLAYYNTADSIDGQWYVFIIDGDDVVRAHAANPALVNRPVAAAVGPNAYPAGEAVAAVAAEAGVWFDYTFPNPATGAAETKHSWLVRYDGLVFGSGWHERGPAKADAPAYTQAFVRQAINLYDALGRDATLAYYNTRDSVDGQWYVFIVGEDGVTIAHHNPEFRGRDPSLRIDATGYFYGDDLLGATESGRWVDYVLVSPASGQDRQKHTWAVLHDGLIFGSGWYED